MALVNDTDDCRISRWLTWVEREGGLAASDEEHLFVNAGADRVQRDERSSRGLAGGIDRLEEEEPDPIKIGVLQGGDDVADDAGELHG
jgi:hypothetical protein